MGTESEIMGCRQCAALPIDFRSAHRPGGDVWESRRADVDDCLSYQAKACGSTLLSSAGIEETSKTRRLMTKAIWETVNPEIYYATRSQSLDSLVFSLGDDPGQIVRMKRGNDCKVVVVSGTTIALPFDKQTRTFFLPVSEESFPLGDLRWKGVLYSPEYTSMCRRQSEANKINNLRFKDKVRSLPSFSWKPYGIGTAQEAVFASVDPRLAFWCLEKSGARKFIELTRWPSADETAVRREHNRTIKSFRAAAVNACITKWGRVIDPEDIKAVFARQKDIVTAHGDNVSIDCMNLHHRHPVFWGGGNKTRTYINQDLHALIHKDIDRTEERLAFCMGEKPATLLNDGAMKDFIVDNPEIVEKLNKIPKVKVENDALSIAVIWPPEIYCLSSLLLFEYQFGGLRGPGDKNYIENPVVRKRQGTWPTFDKN